MKAKAIFILPKKSLATIDKYYKFKIVSLYLSKQFTRNIYHLEQNQK